MRGVGLVFSRFLEVDINTGVIIGMIIVLFYAVLGGMKGITYTQVAQYCVLIFAFMVPAIFISVQMTDHVIPQLGFGGTDENGVYLLDKLDKLHRELGFHEYTTGSKSTLDVFLITAALMVGTAGLPHVIVRFFTVPKVKDARKSAGYALFLIAILYTTAPAISVFSRTNLIETVSETKYSEIPEWFKNWENTGLIAWTDKNGDGKIQYIAGNALDGKKPVYTETRGIYGERMIANASAARNELYVDRDIMVLANPEIAGLPNWVIALVAAGGLAAALSTAAGLLLVISTSISHDLIKKQIKPDFSVKGDWRQSNTKIFIDGEKQEEAGFGSYFKGFSASERGTKEVKITSSTGDNIVLNVDPVAPLEILSINGVDKGGDIKISGKEDIIIELKGGDADPDSELYVEMIVKASGLKVQSHLFPSKATNRIVVPKESLKAFETSPLPIAKKKYNFCNKS